MRDQILSEIRRLATNAGGKPPGKKLFAQQTGVREHQWSGVFWSRWGDALAEAGLERNALQGRYDSIDVLMKIVEACRYYQRIPSLAEMKMYRLQDTTFPSHGTIRSHYPKSKLVSALSTYAEQNQGFEDIRAMLPAIQASDDVPSRETNVRIDGYVYLLKSGSHYKVGRSDQLERRVKEIRISLPEEITLIHAIKTDDPSGIEAYWHRRFSYRRANGEWFKLGLDDVSAFRRRKYQ